jgi:hypothetical protein
MFGFILGVTARTYDALRRFMPTNMVLDLVHTRRGLKWGVPAMLLAVPYALAAVACAGLAGGAGSGWLSGLALLFVWDALKFIIAGPVTLVRLLRVRSQEARLQRFAHPSHLHADAKATGATPGEVDQGSLRPGTVGIPLGRGRLAERSPRGRRPHHDDPPGALR